MRLSKRYLVLPLAAALACAPRAPAEPVPGPPPEPDVPAESAPDRWVEETLAGMSLREKVGQMLFPRVPVDYLPAAGDAYLRLRTWVAGGPRWDRASFR